MQRSMYSLLAKRVSHEIHFGNAVQQRTHIRRMNLNLILIILALRATVGYPRPPTPNCTASRQAIRIQFQKACGIRRSSGKRRREIIARLDAKAATRRSRDARRRKNATARAAMATASISWQSPTLSRNTAPREMDS